MLGSGSDSRSGVAFDDSEHDANSGGPDGLDLFVTDQPADLVRPPVRTSLSPSFPTSSSFDLPSGAFLGGTLSDEREFVVVCEGRRLSCQAEDLEGFRQRAKNSFFQALLDPEADLLRDASGALVIKDVPLAMVERVWEYLTLGLQPGERSYEEFVDWRHICDYFTILVPDPLADLRRMGIEANAYATHQYLMVRTSRTAAAELSPMCYSMRCSTACSLQQAPLGFDQVSEADALHLQARNAEIPLEVELDPCRGNLRIRFMREAMWQHIGGHACLRHKCMKALKVRFPKHVPSAPSTSTSGSSGAGNGVGNVGGGGVGTAAANAAGATGGSSASSPQPFEVGSSGAAGSGCGGGKGDQYQMVELYIHAAPPGLASASPCIAHWPSFWCLVRVVRYRAYNHSTWCSWNATFEICPGALFMMADDLIVQVVSQPRSLRKCYLRVCGGDLEQEVRAKLVAPAPFSTPHANGGKGKASFPGKGVGPSLIAGQKYYKYAVPSYDTPTPEEASRKLVERCMQDVWIVRRRGPGPPQLVLLLHAADGRVTLAQLSGENGCIPQLYGTGGGPVPGRRTCAIWGAKAWHWGQHGVGSIGQYRRSYDVPKCHEVMAVALEAKNRIVILHKPRARDSPQLWAVSPPQNTDMVPSGSTHSFFRIHGKGKGAGGKSKGGKGSSIGRAQGGSWMDDRWGTANARQLVLPDDIVAPPPNPDRTRGSAMNAFDVAEEEEWPLFVPLWAGNPKEAPEVEVLRLTGACLPDEPRIRSRGHSSTFGSSAFGQFFPSGGSRSTFLPTRGIPGLSHTRAGAEPARPSIDAGSPAVTWGVSSHVHYTCRQPLVPR